MILKLQQHAAAYNYTARRRIQLYNFDFSQIVGILCTIKDSSCFTSQCSLLLLYRLQSAFNIAILVFW